MAYKSVWVICSECGHRQEDIEGHPEGFDPCGKCAAYAMTAEEGIFEQSSQKNAKELNIKGWASWG